MRTPEISDGVLSKAGSQFGQQTDLARPEERAGQVSLPSIALNGLFVLAIFYTLKLASSFFVPLVLAILLKFLFASVIRGMERFHIPAPVGAALVILGLLSTLGFGVYQLAGPTREWMAKLPQTARQIEGKLQDLKRSVREVSKAGEEVDRLTNLGGKEQIQRVEVRKPSLGETLLGPTQDFLVSAGVLVILLFFLLASGDLFLRKLVAVLPRLEEKKLAVEITRRIELDVSAYLLAITLINALFGTTVAIAMFFLGLPNPVLWGVMAGLLHFIPFLGAVVGISIVTLVALVTLDSTATILLVPTIYFALNLLEEYVVLPVVIGRRLMLNAGVVLLWLLFWAWLWGVPGALMAVPLLAIVKIVADHFDPLASLAEFIGR
ncbi:MAG TPA: AI-2E family transporter [Candidatus Saccharimonadales bacterium]|nr:AI-2E family transporter [Candidatus Saccharimonadales bacterium]